MRDSIELMPSVIPVQRSYCSGANNIYTAVRLMLL